MFALGIRRVLQPSAMGKPTFITDLTDSIHQLKLNQLLCDVTIVTDDGDVFAHSVILAAVSPLMCNMFVTLSSKSDASCQLMYSIDLHGYKAADVDAALHYLYTGHTVTASGERDMKLTCCILNILESLGVDKKLYADEDEVL